MWAMSLRERLLLVLGLVGAIGLVVYPLAYRLSTEGAAASVVAPPSPGASGSSASGTPSPRPTPTRIRPTVRPIDPSWTTDAVGHRGLDGDTFEYECSPDGSYGQIWGTDIYTDDTSICTAGVHAGVITREAGGTVSIVIRPGQESYEGSLRNDVRSEPYLAWDGSYEVVRP
jgi:hypothetical protein